MRIECDFLIIGTGVAGLTFARLVAGKGKVILLSKNKVEDSATYQAQGGVASVTDINDSFDSHINDTIVAGRGLCHRDIVEMCVKKGPSGISDLINLGAEFTKKKDNPNALDLGQEGGHSVRRIVHADDATGKEMIRALLETVRKLDNVKIIEDHMAVELIVPSRKNKDRVCKGAYVLEKETGEIHTVLAPVTIVATGGAGKAYLYTSNPDIATGDGIAMGYRIGAKVANMEFFQFHPTILFHPQAKSILISEAVRGEGGILRNSEGQAFMKNYHPKKELAPRDVVARAIDSELKRSGDDHVCLDVTHLDSSFIKDRFPNIYKTCLKYGIDMTTQQIPVVPGAHYVCGGLLTDQYGHTTVPGLFAIGETAFTGLHGANRLASNSLLEGLVFADAAATAALKIDTPCFNDVKNWESGHAIKSDESVVVSQDWDEIRRYMWNYVGIVRSNKRLARAKRRHDMMLAEIKDYYWRYLITSDLLELRNISTIAHLIITSAIQRKESRGLHYNSDYVYEDKHFEKDTILSRFKD